ncbi:MAG: N-glycosylase/DNA lyase [Candidatus Woesearchaeota archaeon]
MSLIAETKRLSHGPVGTQVEKRLRQFKSFDKKAPKEWFSELCFCLLTANSKAKTSLAIQADLGANGFCSASAADVKKCIVKHKHRFHNNKTAFIVGARNHLDIKDKISALLKSSEDQARVWLVKNIKGLGYKEASHFLRNTGCTDLAIVDRHIINVLVEYGLITRPKTVTKRVYLVIEKKLRLLAQELGMSLAELDLYLWYMKTGQVLK